MTQSHSHLSKRWVMLLPYTCLSSIFTEVFCVLLLSLLIRHKSTHCTLIPLTILSVHYLNKVYMPLISKYDSYIHRKVGLLTK